MGLADEAYLKWVRRQECVACPFDGPMQAHHLKGGKGDRRGGMGIRVHDKLTIPMCSRHHKQFHRGEGLFSGWEKEFKRIWQEAWIQVMQERYAMETDF